MNLKSIIQRLIVKLPYVRTLYREKLNAKFPNGHYYSSVVSLVVMKKAENKIWKNVGIDGILGVDLNVDQQLKLVNDLRSYYAELPFAEDKNDQNRYYYNNDYYRHTDAIVLYSMIRHFKPKQIIEVGSGYSSAVMLDTNQHFMAESIRLTFIDPHTERLNSLLSENDKKSCVVLESDIQEISLHVFENLNENDILFIDSTHVSKTGSDVNYILFEILPVIKSGVLIHFHDIFYPFEYPKEWVMSGFNWNEDYILKAFLMYNEKFKIRLFSEYLHLHHGEIFKKMPLSLKNTGGSLWIQKL